MASFNHSNTSLQICVDTIETRASSTGDGGFGGRIFGRRLKMPLEFFNMTDFLLKIEALMDAQKFPRAFQRARSFRPKDEMSVFAAETPEDGMSAQEVSSASGSRATFSILVISRRDSTWQGRIDKLDGNKAEEFSSVLELIHMIDELLAAIG